MPTTARRILVGYDHSEEAAGGLRRAAALAGAQRAELTVVHVVVPPPTWAGTGLIALPIVDDLVATGETLVRRAVDELPADLCVRWHLLTGPETCAAVGRRRCVRRALQRTLDDGGFDLLVVGTGLRPGRIARALLRRRPDRVLTAPFAAAPTGVPAGPAARPTISL